jgi:pimeloyl-ACP methyl ester carboxylesterase
VTELDGRNATAVTRGYAAIDGLNAYYEIDGRGDPVVYIPPILGVAGVNAVPALARSRSVITIDLQGHGRTADVPDRPITLEQNATDVIAVLKFLGISRVDLFGESYGGATAILIALRQPALVGRVATYGATFGPPEVAHNRQMLRFDGHPPTPHSRSFQFQRESYRKVAPDPESWSTLWGKVAGIRWEGFSNDELGSIGVPVLVAVGDHDFVRVEHATEAFKRIPHAELAVIPDAGHFALFSEQERVIPVVEHFLNKARVRPPIATSEMGYHPDETR